MHLNHLTHKMLGELTFILEEPLHIGTGEYGARRSLLRVDGKVVIPSSTWKGALRSIAETVALSMLESLTGLERLAVAYYREDGQGITYKKDQQAEHYLKRKLGQQVAEQLRKEYDKALEEFKNEVKRQHKAWKANENWAELGEELKLMLDIGYDLKGIDEIDEKLAEDMFADYLATRCPIGALFGNQVLAGKVRPMDTLLDASTPEIRPGVGIDRRKGTVRGDVLYFTEAVRAGTRVKLYLLADNLEPGSIDSRVMAGVLEWIRTLGLQIGGRKTVGYGLMRLEGARFYYWQLGKDEDEYGGILGNPFERAKQYDLEGAISLLRGAPSGHGPG